MTENTQSCDKSVIRLDDISTIQLDILVELQFKINEDALTVKKTSYSQNTSSNHKTQNHSQSVKLGSNMNRLNHEVLQQIDAVHFVQNFPAGYADLPRFEESGRKFVIAKDTFRNKISEFRQGLVYLVYNSKVALYNVNFLNCFRSQVASILTQTNHDLSSTDAIEEKINLISNTNGTG